MVLPLAAILTACLSPNRLPVPPEDRLVCLPEPARPAGLGEPYLDASGAERRAVTDAEDAQYKADLRASWFSCWDNIGYLRRWFAEFR